jgi:hypothetical protein
MINFFSKPEHRAYRVVVTRRRQKINATNIQTSKILSLAGFTYFDGGYLLLQNSTILQSLNRLGLFHPVYLIIDSDICLTYKKAPPNSICSVL